MATGKMRGKEGVLMWIRTECRIDDINSPERFVLIGHWLFTKVFFPRSMPASHERWEHVNGKARLAFLPESDDGLIERREEYLGVPYGPKARLVLLHVLALALLRNSRRVEVPVGIKRFAGFLGFDHNDGETGRAIRAQMARLCSGRLELSFSGSGAGHNGGVKFSGRIFSEQPSELFGADGRGFPTELTLTSEFFSLLKGGWFSFRREHVVALRGNSLAIDLYLWLVDRLGRLEGRGMNRYLRWGLVQKDFKGLYANSGGFSRAFREAARLVESVDRSLNGVFDFRKGRGLRVNNDYVRPEAFDPKRSDPEIL